MKIKEIVFGKTKMAGDGDKIRSDTFDFEDWDDTDISGMRMEMEINNLIEQTQRDIDRGMANYSPSIKRQARNEIKRLWMDRIMEWK